MMPDSDSTPRQLPDDDQRPDADDEAIDLGHLEPVEEGVSAALSFSRGSNSQNSGLTSAIRSWEDLVREAAAEPDAEEVSHEPSSAASNFDADSDKDLLHAVLADEQPPSKIILKDPSQGEMPALPPEPKVKPTGDPESVLGEFEDVPASASGTSLSSPSGRFALPPELAATRPDEPASGAALRPPSADDDAFHIAADLERPDNSSILGHSSPTGASNSGLPSDLWGSSSRVDLLKPGTPLEMSSGSLERTDEVDDSSIVRAPSGDSSQSLFGAGPDSGVESSAVDLGGRPLADLPFPLGLDSSVGSSVVRPDRPIEPPSKPEPDSGTVDLLSAAEFDLGLPESQTSPSWADAREDLPPTVPLVPAGQGRGIAWVGGGTAGLLVGVAACAGLWFAGWVPAKSAGPASATGNSNDARLRAAEEQARQAQAARDALAAKFDAAAGDAKQAQAARDALAAKVKAAAADSKRAAAELGRVSAQLAQARAATEEAKRLAKVREDKVIAKLAEESTAGVELKKSVEQLTSAKTAADLAVRQADTRLAGLRDQLAQAEANAGRLKSQADRADAARKQSAAFVAEVARRLQTRRARTDR